MIGFEYDILCQRAQADQELQDVLENNLSRLLGEAPKLIFIPGNRWPEIRQRYLSEHGTASNEATKKEEVPKTQTVPPIVSKAQELFGADLIEIKND